jgi:hypothetical protein
MTRKIPKGRLRTAIYFFYFYLHIASCTSVAPMTVFLQSPAFFSFPQDQLDLLFFECTGARRLEAYQRARVRDNRLVYGLSGSGERHIAVLSAHRDSLFPYAGIRHYGDLCETVAWLGHEDPDHPRLYGETEVAPGVSRTAEVRLQPALCSIRLRSVACDFSGRPYAGSRFESTRLYLTHAGTEYPPFGPAGRMPLQWMNVGAADSLSCLSLPHPEMLLQEGLGPVGSLRQTADRCFCCYPNPATEDVLGLSRTCLVLEGRVNGIRCYYPLPLPGMQPGDAYTLDVTLLRMGTPRPDLPAEAGSYQLDIRTEPWRYVPPLEQTF